jgi:hypothetical protein
MKWEYVVLHMPQTKDWDTVEGLTRWLNEQGEQGWELIFAPGYHIFYFKREKVEDGRTN